MFLPGWSVDLRLCRWRRDRPDAPTPALLLVKLLHQRRVIAHACPRARAAGVAPGMDLAHARALLPSGNGAVAVRWSDPAGDRAAMLRLAAWAGRFSPVVGLDEPLSVPGDAPACPDGLLLDITGCQLAAGGARTRAHSEPSAEAGLLRRLLGGVLRRGLGSGARVACASSTGAARALARWAPASAGACVSVGPVASCLRAAVDGLPVEALGLRRAGPEGARAEALMRRVGLRTIGAVLAVPRSELASRLGAGALVAIDELLGERAASIVPVRAADPLRAAWTFHGPVASLEGVMLAVRAALAGESEGGAGTGRWLPERGDDEGSRPEVGLCQLLARRGLGARRVDVRLERVRAAPVELTVRTSRPTRDPRRLWSLLRPMLERADLGEGVERVVVRAGGSRGGLGRVRGEQRVLPGEPGRARVSDDAGDSAGAAGHDARDELVDALSNRLGPGRVLRVRRGDSHLPERAGGTAPAIEPSPPVRAAPPMAEPAPRAPDRPTILLDRPEPADVVAMVPDGPPARVRWRGLWREVALAQGPERIAEEWWRRSAPPAGAGAWSWLGRRDYYRVRTGEGAWLWLVRCEPAGRWFVHGLWA